MLDFARALRVLSRWLGWFVVATIALAAALLLLNRGAAGPQMSGALWGGVLVAMVVVLGGRVLLPRLFEALAFRLLPDDAQGDLRRKSRASGNEDVHK